jgi:hypothetical protein
MEFPLDDLGVDVRRQRHSREFHPERIRSIVVLLDEGEGESGPVPARPIPMVEERLEDDQGRPRLTARIAAWTREPVDDQY